MMMRLLAVLVVASGGCSGTDVGVDASTSDSSVLDAGTDLDTALPDSAFGDLLEPSADAATAPSITYAQLATSALATVNAFYDKGPGRWHLCLPTTNCPSSTNTDWGAGTMTSLLWLHWELTHDASVVPLATALVKSLPDYKATAEPWSDQALWDSISASHDWDMTSGSADALTKAKDAFVVIDGSTLYAEGFCPEIDYQQPSGGGNKLKTLETDANYVKAALLLYDETKDTSYLTKAETKYAAVRKWFLDPKLPLYTVYVIDDGKTCSQIAQRFFASVNGIMIDAGLSLYTATKTKSYEDDAIASAQALAALDDANGVYADLQAANDTSEPLIEAMYHLSQSGQTSATTWLLGSASAAGAASATQGTYGRFFDGPAPTGMSDAWQTSGGLAVEMVAGTLAPTEGPADPSAWSSATYTAHDLTVTTTAATLTVTGEALAIIGTVGETTFESGHIGLLIDGVPTEDQTGIWQNKDSLGLKEPDQVLFAWRWPKPGMHTITFEPGVQNAKEGMSYFHMTGYTLK